MADANYSEHGKAEEEFNRAELSDIQDRLARMMDNSDDKEKRLIFNQVICKLTGSLPELPPVAPVKEAPSTVTLDWSDWSNACDKLAEASYAAQFIQSISLNIRPGDSLTLQGGQLTGFYYAMQNSIDLITYARALLDVEKPETSLQKSNA